MIASTAGSRTLAAVHRERPTPGSDAIGRRRERTRRMAVEAAIRHFAEKGFRGTRLEDVAAEVGMTRAALLKHFGSKDELFFEAHRAAVLSLPSYLDAPEEVLALGVFETLRYWLERSEHLAQDDRNEYRVELVGKYGAEPQMQDRITRFWLLEDPDKTLDLVEMGVRRGEIRDDLDVYLVAAMVDWVVEGAQRSMIAEELDRGLFHRRADALERRTQAVDTIVDALRRAIGTASVNGSPPTTDPRSSGPGRTDRS